MCRGTRSTAATATSSAAGGISRTGGISGAIGGSTWAGADNEAMWWLACSAGRCSLPAQQLSAAAWLVAWVRPSAPAHGSWCAQQAIRPSGVACQPPHAPTLLTGMTSRSPKASSKRNRTPTTHTMRPTRDACQTVRENARTTRGEPARLARAAHSHATPVPLRPDDCGPRLRSSPPGRRAAGDVAGAGPTAPESGFPQAAPRPARCHHRCRHRAGGDPRTAAP